MDNNISRRAVAPTDPPGFIGPPEPCPSAHPPSSIESSGDLTILGLTDLQENVLAAFFIAMFLILAAALFIWAVQPRPSQPCDDPQSFVCLDHRVHECMASEQYTKDQCVTLVGGTK